MKPSLSIHEAIDHLLKQARARKTEMEVLAHDRKSTSISFQQKKMEQFSRSESRQLGIRILQAKSEGLAYTERFDPQSLDQLIEDAAANARSIQRPWMTQLQTAQALPELKGIYNPALEAVELEQKIQAAHDLESTALAYDPRITNVAYARYGDSSSQIWIANTQGLNGSYRVNSCFVFTRCMANDGQANVMSGDVDVQRDFHQLNPKKLATTAAEKTLSRLGAVRPTTGKYTVVFENRVAEDLLDLMSSYFSAKSVDEKTSPLSGRVMQKIFSTNFNLTDDPFLTGALASRPFDDEGYTSKKTELVKNGVLQTFLTNSTLARKLGLPHTASAARSPASELGVASSNLVVTPGTESLEQLLNAGQKVILVTELLGHAGFRRSSGDFSLPFEGHLYENGKRSVALKDFLISGNILDLFAHIEAVGNDLRAPAGTTLCPSLLVSDLNVAGQA